MLDVEWIYKTREIPSLLWSGEKILNPDLLRSRNQQRQLGKGKPLECSVVLVYSGALAHLAEEHLNVSVTNCSGKRVHVILFKRTKTWRRGFYSKEEEAWTNEAGGGSLYFGRSVSWETHFIFPVDLTPMKISEDVEVPLISKCSIPHEMLFVSHSLQD